MVRRLLVGLGLCARPTVPLNPETGSSQHRARGREGGDRGLGESYTQADQDMSAHGAADGPAKEATHAPPVSLGDTTASLNAPSHIGRGGKSDRMPPSTKVRIDTSSPDLKSAGATESRSVAGRALQNIEVLPVAPHAERQRRRLSTDVSTFNELSSAIGSDADINVVSDITFTGSITISGQTNVSIGSSTGAVLTSDQSFTASYGGMFHVDSGSDVTFTGLGFVSGSASYSGGCVYVTGSTVEFDDVDLTSCVTVSNLST